MSRQYFSGKTIETAILEAASHFKISPDEVLYRKIEKKHGFTKTPKVVIVVDPEQPKKKPEDGKVEAQTAQKKEPDVKRENESMVETRDELGEDLDHEAEPEDLNVASTTHEQDEEPLSTPLSAEAVEPVAYETLQDLFELAQIRLDAEVRLDEDGLDVELFGPDREVAWQENGELLRLVEHLLPRLIRDCTGQLIPCRADCEGYMDKRYNEILDHAQAAATQVLEFGEDVLLETMNPAERRWVHMEIKEIEGVATESEGRGFLKRVRVFEDRE